MLDYFPKFFSVRAIICYVLTLVLASALFIGNAMPFQFVLFGFVAVAVFFSFSNRLTVNWRQLSPERFAKNLFCAALIIRVVYVLFIYFYYIEMTGQPYEYAAADSLFYQKTAELLRREGFGALNTHLNKYTAFSDRGYVWWLAIEYAVMGTHVLTARIVKCVIDAFSCVLIYNLAKRNFGEAAGRIAAVFCLLMPNMWYYCGVTLKETEMAFLTILFVERGDYALRTPKILLRNFILPGLVVIAMFTLRTTLAIVLLAALTAALILSSGKKLQVWKKVLYIVIFAGWMFLTVGVEAVQETRSIWNDRTTNQTVGYEWRANRMGGNELARYAKASFFAPLLFTIPFSSMVAVHDQENIMMMNGANFIKNILSGFVIYVLITLLVSGKWRRHVLPISLMCGYLVVLVFSNFAHSERYHFPVLALELMFAAYGITLMKNKHKRWYVIWLVLVCVANVAWCWIKLKGRGLV